MVVHHAVKFDIIRYLASMHGIMVGKEVNAMTIEERIHSELDRLSKANAEIHSAASKLNEKFVELIGKVKDHLGEISKEMTEFDKHDASHSEAVLRIIEELLQAQHIEELTLLEAMVLRFCCYFHDTGMILPAYCLPLLEQVEKDPKAEPKDGLKTWLRGKGNDFDSRKELFLLPEKREKYPNFLIRELMAYRDFRLGLEPKPEDMDRERYIRQTRHYYLRKQHGERSKIYAANLSRFFAESIHGSEAELAKIIGEICAAHSWEIKDVLKLSVQKELFDNCPEMSCNVRYLAMLLRLGDLLHFGPERSSETLYLERESMDAESDLHWKAKQGTRGYRISPNASGGVDIAYHGSFDVPREYYFVQGHMNWVDRELSCYENFRRQMEVRRAERKYDLGLPEKVNREHLDPQGFTPDRDFKFKLEHRNIIELLMGARLYRDEFMCLRELYQNALDACRCMRAERPGVEREIEFGLGTDDNGDYLYCKDQGTGMTMDIVKNYLLRIGNSYYKSDEFRRKNAHWDNAVAPVSEFGIGLLSCYMIADRIDVITRHYTAVEEEKPIWISMTDNDDFGYQLETDWFIEDELGEHGTIVRLYLKEKYKPMATGYIPEEPKDAAFLLEYLDSDKLRGCALYEQYKNSLYHRVQQFVHIPEDGIPVYIRGADRRAPIFRADECYDLAQRYPKLKELLGSDAYSMLSEMLYDIIDYRYRRIYAKKYLVETFLSTASQWETYLVPEEDAAEKTSASVMLRLPKVLPQDEHDWDLLHLSFSVCWGYRAVYIDGMPVHHGDWEESVRYSFRGKARPRLTVDRGDIRETSENVRILRDTLRSKLAEKVADLLRSHIRQYPAVDDVAFWNAFIGYISCAEQSELGGIVLRELSRDVLKDHLVCGVPLHDWFWEAEQEAEGSVLQRCPNVLKKELVTLIMNAESLRLDNKTLRIRRGPQRLIGEEETAAIRRLCMYYSNLAVRVDEWPEEYGAYDAVSTLEGMVQRTTWEKLHKNAILENRICEIYGNFFSQNDPVWLDTPSWQDVLLFLQEPQDQRGIHSSPYNSFFHMDGSKRYVAYVFVPPRTLTAEEEAELERYRLIPEYIRGVREGWSILFYDYKNGYVIAPGIQKREDMLKLLPREALEHDDGLEYYFTDDTFAF